MTLLDDARLSPDQARTVFGAILDAACRPAAVVGLPGGGDVPPALIPALALADLDVAVAVLDDDDSWGEHLRVVTGCRTAPADDADLVVALRPPAPGEIAGLRTGTAQAPERGARLFAGCRSLADSHGAGSEVTATVHIRLQGPGAPDGLRRRPRRRAAGRRGEDAMMASLDPRFGGAKCDGWSPHRDSSGHTSARQRSRVR